MGAGLPRRIVIVASVCAALAAIAFGCAAFDTEPTAAADAAPPESSDAATPVAPGVKGCAGVVIPNLAFCSDFDNDAGLSGWEKDDPEEGIYGLSDEHVSPGSSARLQSRDGGGSPDARIRRALPDGKRIVVSGAMRVKQTDTEPVVQLVKISFKGDTGSVWLKSNGDFVEVRKVNGVADPKVTPTKIAVLGDKWVEFTMSIDFVRREASVAVGGVSEALPLADNKVSIEGLILGPGEPNAADRGWIVLFDNVTAVVEPR